MVVELTSVLKKAENYLLINSFKRIVLYIDDVFLCYRILVDVSQKHKFVIDCNNEGKNVNCTTSNFHTYL